MTQPFRKFVRDYKLEKKVELEPTRLIPVIRAKYGYVFPVLSEPTKLGVYRNGGVAELFDPFVPKQRIAACMIVGLHIRHRSFPNEAI